MSLQSISLPVPKVKKRRWGKPKPGESLKMLAAGSLAFAKAYSSVEKLEIELEAEIQRDKDNDPDKGKGINKWRRKGGKLLLSKYMLLFIVVLNIIDCTLVLGELILDLHHVKDILFDSQQSSETFIDELQRQYPDQFSDIQDNQLDTVYDRILQSHLVWPLGINNSKSSSVSVTSDINRTAVIVQSNDSVTNNADGVSPNGNNVFGKYNVNESRHNMSRIIRQQMVDSSMQTSDTEEDKSVLKTVGFIFHKISLSISVILVIWIALKIICFGKRLLHRRLEVFDTFVILTSFIVDMIFVKGLSMYTLKQFVYILAFMLPWRVIRVTNSLVVAVKDHEHFRLKMLFTQKKKIEHENKQTRSERDSYKEQVEALKKLCLSEGIDDWKIFQSLARQQIRPGNKGAMGSFASLAFGAFGNKSSSFWSVLGTPKMRRGKSMELVNKVNNIDPNILNTKRHSKGKIFSFLGNSADYIRGKIKNGHHLSIDSDPGISSNYLKTSVNGHIGKRLVRGETIDTMSTDSIDDSHEHNCGPDDLSKQGTFDSNTGDEAPSISPIPESKAMQRAQSDCVTTRPPLFHSQRLREDMGPGNRDRRASSVGAMDSLTVDYHPNYSTMDSDESIIEKEDIGL